MIAYLELADYLLIAESVLVVPAEAIANFNRIGLAQSALYAPQAGFGGVEAYPNFVRIVRNILRASASTRDPRCERARDTSFRRLHAVDA